MSHAHQNNINPLRAVVPPRIGCMAERSAARAVAPLVIVVGLLVAYGFEIFSFTLTLDEELFAAGVRGVDAWISEGRWSMAMLYLLVPSAIVPAVSTALGVGLMGLALWLIARRHLALGPATAAAAVLLAATVPVLAFLFSFSTIAYGIGVAALLTVVWCWAISSPSWLRGGIGIVAGATAVGIYDSFLAVLAVLSLALIARRARWRPGVFAIAALPAAFLLSRVVAWVVQSLTGVRQEAYVGTFIDLGGLIADPGGRLRRAAGATWNTLTLSEARFGTSSPWLIVVLAALGGLAVLWAVRSSGSARVRGLRLTAIVLIGLVPLGAESLSPSGLNLRSMVYLPFVILVLAAFAARGLGTLRRGTIRGVAVGGLAALMVLAVVGQSTIANRLFASAHASYLLDRQLAFTIGQDALRLAPEGTRLPLPIVVSGLHGWPDTELLPSRETLGVSFFEKSSAGSVRVISFLQVEGVQVVAPSALQATEGKDDLRDMPAYPEEGWIAVRDGVLLVKLGD
jgi:hypothetical protein